MVFPRGAFGEPSAYGHCHQKSTHETCAFEDGKAVDVPFNLGSRLECLRFVECNRRTGP